MNDNSRERERQYEREKFWNHLENLAASSPDYEILKMKQTIEMNNIANSPNEDEEISLDNMEHEAQEVNYVSSTNPFKFCDYQN